MYSPMWRKPSASHWLQKLPLDLYRPSSFVLSCGLIWLMMPSLKRWAGYFSSRRPVASRT